MRILYCTLKRLNRKLTKTDINVLRLADRRYGFFFGVRDNDWEEYIEDMIENEDELFEVYNFKAPTKIFFYVSKEYPINELLINIIEIFQNYFRRVNGILKVHEEINLTENDFSVIDYDENENKVILNNYFYFRTNQDLSKFLLYTSNRLKNYNGFENISLISVPFDDNKIDFITKHEKIMSNMESQEILCERQLGILLIKLSRNRGKRDFVQFISDEDGDKMEKIQFYSDANMKKLEKNN